MENTDSSFVGLTSDYSVNYASSLHVNEKIFCDDIFITQLKIINFEIIL